MYSLCVSLKCGNRDSAKELMQQEKPSELVVVFLKKFAKMPASTGLSAKLTVSLSR